MLPCEGSVDILIAKTCEFVGCCLFPVYQLSATALE